MAACEAVEDVSEVGFGIEAVQFCALCRTPNYAERPGGGHGRCHGCSTLCGSDHFQEAVDAGNGGTVAVLGARCGFVGRENVEGEAAQPGEDAGIGSNARAVFAKGDVAAVMGGVLYGPMSACGFGGSLGGERRVGSVECGLAGPCPGW